MPSRLFSAHIFPSSASTILLDINKPRPVPVIDFVAHFVNNLGYISISIRNVHAIEALDKTAKVDPNTGNTKEYRVSIKLAFGVER
jgi:hypothetical protein